MHTLFVTMYTSEIHLAYIKIGSEMPIPRVIATWMNKFWFGSPCRAISHKTKYYDITLSNKILVGKAFARSLLLDIVIMEFVIRCSNFKCIQSFKNKKFFKDFYCFNSLRLKQQSCWRLVQFFYKDNKYSRLDFVLH